MSKYEPLWRFLSGDGSGCIQFSFERIEEILGFPLAHSFLRYKQEAEQYGYRVEKILLKEKWVRFVRIAVPPDTTEYPKSSHLYTAISRSMKVAFFIVKLRLPRAIRAWHTCLRLSHHTSQKSLSVALLQPANFCIV